jgi:hypothetical protein
MNRADLGLYAQDLGELLGGVELIANGIVHRRSSSSDQPPTSEGGACWRFRILGTP